MRHLLPLWSERLRMAVLAIAIGLWFPAELPALDAFDPTKREGVSPVATIAAEQLPSFAEVAKNAMPAVVNISTTQKPTRRPRAFPSPQPGPSPFGEGDPFEEFFRRFFGDRPPPRAQRSLGSGFIISADGYIVTNQHVIGEAAQIKVRLSGNEEYTAKVIGTDDKTDLALIKVNAPRPLPTISLGTSANLDIGDWVLAIGNPFGLEQTVTAGIVSAKGRMIGAGPYDDFIQTDASINPGNSGGPLLNLRGEVVGINTAIFSQGGGNIGIGFAIPVDLAKSVLTQLREKGKVTRAWLGITIQSVTPELAKSFGLEESTGALVAEVTPDSPAAKAGIERGDVVISFNNIQIKDSHELPALVAQNPVGTPAEVTVLRGGRKQSFTVTLGELTDQQAEAQSGEESRGSWGMAVAGLTPEVRRRFQLESDQVGVVVVQVEPGSPAEDAGVRPGDVIEEVNRRSIKSMEDFTNAIQGTKEQNALLLLLRRGTSTLFFVLQKTAE
jgi:serine protease Do